MASDERDSIYCQFQVGDHHPDMEETDNHVLRGSSVDSGPSLFPPLHGDQNHTESSLSMVSSIEDNESCSGSATFRPQSLGNNNQRIKCLLRDEDIERRAGSLPKVLRDKPPLPGLQQRSPEHRPPGPVIKTSGGRHISAPPTPSGDNGLFICSSWADPESSRYLKRGSIASIDERQEYGLLSPDDAISVSSVEGYPCSDKRKHKSISRLSLNLGVVNLKDERLTSPSKNASIIPKFLRNSFSRLWGKGKVVDGEITKPDKEHENQNQQTETEIAKESSNEASNIVTTPVIPANSMAPHLSKLIIDNVLSKSASTSTFVEKGEDAVNNVSPSRKLSREHSTSSPEVCGKVPFSPSTMDFFEESRQSGLPVIPFALPTSVVAERMKKRKQQQQKSASNSIESVEKPKSEAKEIPKRRDSVLDYVVKSGEYGPASLDNLVHMAEVELARETLYGISSPEDCVRASSSLATSSCESGSAKWPSELEEPEFEDKNSLNVVWRQSRKEQPPSVTANNKTNQEEGTGYIEMIPNSMVNTKQQESENESSGFHNNHFNSHSKCLLSRMDSEEPFKMDLSSKG